MEAHRLENLSIADYIQIEKETDTKYEYHDGKIFAMAGGTVEHGLISGNIYGEMKFALRAKGSNCTPLNSDIKLYLAHANKILYPDAMVVCGEIERSDREVNAIVNPIVIVEVLSKSTESYDRGDKFYAYRQIQSLVEYVLIDQQKAQIEIYHRTGDLWKITRITGRDARCSLAALDIELSLANIYENIDFPEEA
jgi:Uma2 family endonuclease